MDKEQKAWIMYHLPILTNSGQIVSLPTFQFPAYMKQGETKQNNACPFPPQKT